MYRPYQNRAKRRALHKALMPIMKRTLTARGVRGKRFSAHLNRAPLPLDHKRPYYPSKILFG